MALISINGVSFSEWAPASPVEQWQADASRVRRYLQLSEGNLDAKEAAAKAILGVSRYVNEGGYKYISRSSENGYAGILPDAHPWTDDSGSPYLYASSINATDNLGTWQLDDGNDNYPSYEMARFEVTYSTRSYFINTDSAMETTWGPLFNSLGGFGYPDEGAKLLQGFYNTRYVTKRMRPASKVIVVRQALMGIAGTGTALPEGMPVEQPMWQVQYIWHQVPTSGVPWVAMFKQIGTVNGSETGAPVTTFDGCAAGTLLFQSADPEMGHDAFGNVIWDITYNFLYLPNLNAGGTAQGHNSVLWNNSGTVDYFPVAAMIAGTASGRAPFLASAFSNLFRPDQ